jgi:beta-lactamase class A
MSFRTVVAIGMLLLAACGSTQAVPQERDARDPDLAAIENRTGGRLGVALVDSSGRLLISHRENERFAFCSTFKMPLAVMVLGGAADRRWRLDERLPIRSDDLISNSPVSERAVGEGAISVEAAAEAIVTHSDNSAANLLLRRVGGPQALTTWFRSIGDDVSRLDRFEMALNENASGDPQDTTSPAAMASTTAEIVYRDRLLPADRDRIRRWTSASRTGSRRIRAGLPSSWVSGDKTGTCGTAYNDVAWFEAPNGLAFVLAVYLDRPRVDRAAAEAAIAQVGRVIAERVL